MRNVWFHREFSRLQGGHLKHSHYFGHVSAMAGFVPRITFTGATPREASVEERERLWPPGESGHSPGWLPGAADLLFVAGLDWRYLAASGLGSLPNPRINLIQGIRHGKPDTELYGYLRRKAVRICVSREVADSIEITGRTNGPVLVIPNGTDIEPISPRQDRARHGLRSALIVGYKQPQLAGEIARRFAATDFELHAIVKFRPREDYLDLLSRHQVAVCLPLAQEGFYLPALEAMALGRVVVTTDCIGNRGYCADKENCLMAERTVESLAAATKRALTLPEVDRERIRNGALNTAMAHSLGAERERFHAVLRDIDRLWASG